MERAEGSGGAAWGERRCRRRESAAQACGARRRLAAMQTCGSGWIFVFVFFFVRGFSGVEGEGGSHVIVDLKDCRIGDELVLFILV